MTIVHITTVGGKPMAIMDTNEGITLDMIDGNPRIGASVGPAGDRWAVIGNNVDETCINGVCPVR